MTLFEVISILKGIALNQPNIQSATDGSVYDVMNTNPSVKYDVVHFQQTNHQTDEETDYYGFNIFYISRLEDSLEDNRLQIQSIGKELLDNILRTFCENWGIDFPTITYYPFTQRFNDLCAGCYCNVRIEIPKDIICADDYIAETVPSDKGLKLQDIGITITENGLRVITPDAEYDGIGEIRIETNVPQTIAVLEDKEAEYTSNGSFMLYPSPGFDGMSSVSVDVDVPDRYDEGYDDGKEDGKQEQKSKMTATAFTENGEYTRADGYSAVTVNVAATSDRYDEGYADGENAQRAKLTVTSFTENSTYTRADGWSEVTVDVPTQYQDGYDDGFADGEEAQKNKLSAITITENGLYERPDGYSAITVDVPATTALTDQDLIANLQGDYYVIPDGTDHLRQWAFYNTCFSSITIPNSVRIINAYAFANNTCLTSMTIPSSVTAIGSYVFSGDSALEEMTFEGTTPPTLGNTGNSLGDTAYTFPIYVPCQSIDAYKTAFGTYYSPRISCRSEELITAITLNVANSITDSGTATTTYSPATAYTDIYYTSSDPTKATINASTGVITVVAPGTVTICTIDRLSGLQDCKSVSVAKTQTGATAITINVPSTIYNNATATTTVSPSTATTNLQYSSSDTSKATINASTGAISVKASGTVQFCVTDTISGLQSCKSANVRKKATSITINVPNTVTNAATATTTVSPTGATTSLRYSSSDTSKATINSTTGAITVKASGTVEFCVTDSISNLQSCKTVNVQKGATAITLNVPSLITDSATATTTVSPTGVTKNLTYSSKSPSIATINASTGVITVVSGSSANLRTVTFCVTDSVTSLQDCKAVNVRKSITAMTLNVPSTVNDTATATTTTSPSDAYKGNITYTSSDTSIATINSNGVITVLKDGTVTICAKDTISNIQACKTITVRKSATALHYTADTSTLDADGESRTITIDPTGFDSSSFGLSISGPVATYTRSGNVFTITFPANTSTSSRTFTVTLTGTTYGGTTKSATLNYNQEGKAAIAGSVTVIYNVTSKTQPTVIAMNGLSSHFASITIGSNTYPIPTSNGNGFTIMQQGSGYPVLGYTFSATGRQSVTYNVASDSPMVTGNDTTSFPFLQSLYSTYYTDSLVQANAAVAVAVGSGIKYIPNDFFSDKCGYCGVLKITSVTISNTVVSIGNCAFLGLHYLTGDVVIPSSVQDMGSKLFYWTDSCNGLPGATFSVKMQSSTPCTIKSDTFVVDANNYAITNKIKVPSAALTTYKNAANWRYYTSNLIGY